MTIPTKRLAVTLYPHFSMDDLVASLSESFVSHLLLSALDILKPDQLHKYTNGLENEVRFTTCLGEVVTVSMRISGPDTYYAEILVNKDGSCQCVWEDLTILFGDPFERAVDALVKTVKSALFQFRGAEIEI